MVTVYSLYFTALDAEQMEIFVVIKLFCAPILFGEEAD